MRLFVANRRNFISFDPAELAAVPAIDSERLFLLCRKKGRKARMDPVQSRLLKTIHSLTNG